MKRTILIVIVLLAIVGIAKYIISSRTPQTPEVQLTATTTTTVTPNPTVLSFKDCETAGYPVAESSPRQCRTPDGRVYAEEIVIKSTYVKASADLIRVTTPSPGAVTGKTFTVKGEARGTWFSEASFPIEVRGKDGKLLTTVVAQAQGEWMTENFVPFSAKVIVPTSYTGPATLTLKKDNPSGLPTNDASVSFPITIE